MSSWNNISICPECGKNILVCGGESRPYDQVYGECLECGFEYHTVEGKLDSGQLEEERNNYGYNPKTGEFEDD